MCLPAKDVPLLSWEGFPPCLGVLSRCDDVTIDDGDYDDGDEIDSYNDNGKGYNDNDNDDEKW